MKELESLGAKSIAVLGDVSDEASTERMVNEVAEKLGSLDVMVSGRKKQTCSHNLLVVRSLDR